MDISFSLAIDGRVQPDVPFDEDFAKGAGKVEVTARNSLRFEFATGKSGYLVETGNAASFAKGPVKTRVALRRGQAFRVEWPLTVRDGEPGASLYLNQYDGAGRRIAFATVPMEGAAIAGLIGLRSDVASYSFAVRITGAGALEFGSLSLTALADTTETAAAVEGDGKVADHLRARLVKAIAERRYDLAQTLCDMFPAASLHRQIYQLQLLVARSAYEDAAQFYEHADARLHAQPSARGRYLRALTAMGRKNDINAVLDAAIATEKDPAVVSGLFPYMQYLSSGSRVAAAEKVFGEKSASVKLRIGAVQMLLDSGQVDRAEALAQTLAAGDAVTKSELALLRANIAIRSGRADAIRNISQAFEAFGMAPLSLRDSSAPVSIANITAQAAGLSEALPKTTVIMSFFNAAATVGAALASLQAQSHSDLEILVVDDQSSDNSTQIVEALAANDPRVRLIRQAQNGGTYVARNTALAQATGTFVLTHDSDDWAPPQKVERLVRHLLANPKLVGVRGQMVRFGLGTGFHYRNGYARVDFSSLTFRRDAALAKAGYFNNVRAGADSEYAYRLQRLFGENAIGEIDELINLMAYLPQSLTTGGLFHIDINTGVFSKLRAEYQQSYFRWQENADNLYISFPDQGPLPFSVPPEIKP
jgi:hypothetical protein